MSIQKLPHREVVALGKRLVQTHCSTKPVEMQGLQATLSYHEGLQSPVTPRILFSAVKMVTIGIATIVLPFLNGVIHLSALS